MAAPAKTPTGPGRAADRPTGASTAVFTSDRGSTQAPARVFRKACGTATELNGAVSAARSVYLEKGYPPARHGLANLEFTFFIVLNIVTTDANSAAR